MSSRLLQLQLGWELLAYLGFAWLALPATAGTLHKIAFVFGMYLLVRLLLTIGSYGYAIRWGSSPPANLRTGLAKKIYAFSEEWAAMVILSLFILPFESFWMGSADRLRAIPDGRPPVLLIHGYFMNRGFWFWIRRRLELAGWVVATINLRPALGDIDSYIPLVAERVDAVLVATGTSQVILVGHSMGGLVSRAYLRRTGGGKVAHLITLGTPHHGTRLAELGQGRNARQMRVDSSWLDTLNAQHADSMPPITSVYSYGDNLVVPQESSCLEGVCAAEHIAVPIVGHVAMATSRDFAEVVLAALKDRAKPTS